MEISNSKNTNTGDINTRGGNVHLGDNYYKSIEYASLKKTITRLEKLVELTEDLIEKEEYYQELEAERKKLEEFKEGVISLAETFQKIEIDTDRLKSAKQYFEKGKFKEARAILNTEEIGNEQNRLLEGKQNAQKKLDKYEEGLRNNADEYLVLAKLTAIDYSLEDRFEKTKEHYEASLRSNKNEGNLFSYAYFLQEHNQNNQATPYYQEALEIYRKLAAVNPQTYLPDVGMTLNNLANLQSDKNEYEKAEQSYQEALEIRRKLAAVNPQTYLPDLATTQINMSIYYQESRINRELSIQLVDEAITNLLPFSQIPYIQHYLKVAFNVLRGWEIDVEEYLEKKTAANDG